MRRAALSTSIHLPLTPEGITEAEGLRGRSSSVNTHTAPEVTGGARAGTSTGAVGLGMDAVLEAENNRLQDELRSKIHDLKHVTINIGAELRGQTGVLQDMDTEWDDILGGALSKAMNRVKGLASGSQNNVVLYLILFSLFIFVMMWLLLF